MRLTQFLLKYRPEYLGPIPKFPGNIRTGKHRYVPRVTTFHKLKLWREFKYQEEVMKYISKPFITEEQENAYLKSIERTHPEYWDDFMRRPIEEPMKQSYAADYIQRFNNTRQFEVEEEGN